MRASKHIYRWLILLPLLLVMLAGCLVKKDLTGSFGGLPPGSYWRLGFIQDGLVSHNFLREYAWTLDFDGMRMVFSR